MTGLPPRQCVVFEPGGEVRRYWRGKGTRVWPVGEAGRAEAARFPDTHSARAAVAALRRQRHRLPRLGYEWLPPTVVQLELED